MFFRLLLEMAEELISMKIHVRLKGRFKTIETIDISNMREKLIPQFGSWKAETVNKFS